MKFIKNNFLIFLIIFTFGLFLTNDFGLIDIEKIAIITAVGIDKEDDEFVVSAQVAVPEATNQTTENKKAVVMGKGSSIGSAIKNIGAITGWFPKLAFCNLIIVGNTFLTTDVLSVLDYFSRTLRVQDSAVVVYTENKAKELLTVASPLDNVSSFAMQKVLFKDTGFDKNILTTDIRTFCTGYYADSSSSIMPIIKVEEQDSGTTDGGSGGSGSSGGKENDGTKTSGSTVFDATNTALFKKGIKVGTLTTDETTAYAFLFKDVKETVFEVNDVYIDGEKSNHLLTVLRATPKIIYKVDNDGIFLNISLDLYCKESDSTKGKLGEEFLENYNIKSEVCYKAEQNIKENIEKLVQKEIDTECDFLRLYERVYRFHHEFYDNLRPDLCKKISLTANVSVHGQA